MDELKRMILSHLLEKLSLQQSYLINTRNQASISAAVSGLIATFFGTLIAGDRSVLFGSGPFGLSLFAIFALLCFSASVMFAAFVVVHTHNFTFCFDTHKMLQHVGNSACVDSFLGTYVSDGEWYFEENEKLIAIARNNLFFSFLFGFSQIIPFAVLVMGVEPK